MHPRDKARAGVGGAGVLLAALALALLVAEGMDPVPPRTHAVAVQKARPWFRMRHARYEGMEARSGAPPART
jgi:hypothetical protein